MTVVFFDTVGLVALWSQPDQWHDIAKQAFSALSARREQPLTTTFVLLECGNALTRTRARREVDAFRRQLEEANALVWPTEADGSAAWRAFERGEAAQASIVDHVSFVVMRRLGIRRAFTNDEHFRVAGFETLF
jgi:predicted nucleic acid-binding protein